jgi:hypothetical protein
VSNLDPRPEAVGVPSITLSAAGPCRFFVVGGVPLGERLVVW